MELKRRTVHGACGKKRKAMECSETKTKATATTTEYINVESEITPQIVPQIYSSNKTMTEFQIAKKKDITRHLWNIHDHIYQCNSLLTSSSKTKQKLELNFLELFSFVFFEKIRHSVHFVKVMQIEYPHFECCILSSEFMSYDKKQKIDALFHEKKLCIVNELKLLRFSF